MSILKERFEKNKEELNNINSKLDLLNSEKAELEVEKEALVKQILMEEKLFKNTEWSLCWNDDDDYYLNFVGADFPEVINDLCRHGWHSTFYLDNNIHLHFNDNSRSIYCLDVKQLFIFIKVNELKIVNNEIENRISAMKNDIINLENVLKGFNSK